MTTMSDLETNRGNGTKLESLRTPPTGNASVDDLYRAADSDFEQFWAAQARRLHWTKPFTQTLDWTGAPSRSTCQ